MLPHWLIVCAYVLLCILHVHMDIHCVEIYTLMYGMSISQHIPSYNIKDHFSICFLNHLILYYLILLLIVFQQCIFQLGLLIYVQYHLYLSLCHHQSVSLFICGRLC